MLVETAPALDHLPFMALSYLGWVCLASLLPVTPSFLLLAFPA